MRSLKSERAIDMRRNKSAYTAFQVACGWAGALKKKAKHAFWRSNDAKTAWKCQKKVKYG